MYVVNDENFEDVKANLSNLSESDVLTISVFKNAVAGILEEIQREKRDTLWLFCFLNASHPRYRQRDADDTDLFQSLLPLYQNDQVSFSDDSPAIWCHSSNGVDTGNRLKMNMGNHVSFVCKGFSFDSFLIFEFVFRFIFDIFWISDRVNRSTFGIFNKNISQSNFYVKIKFYN